MSDPAVEALAVVIDDLDADCQTFATQAEAALDHIAAHLHDDTPEGAALREHFGLSVQTCEGVEDVWDLPYPRTERVEVAKGRYENRTVVPSRLVSPWRDA